MTNNKVHPNFSKQSFNGLNHHETRDRKVTNIIAHKKTTFLSAHLLYSFEFLNVTVMMFTIIFLNDFLDSFLPTQPFKSPPVIFVTSAQAQPQTAAGTKYPYIPQTGLLLKRKINRIT